MSNILIINAHQYYEFSKGLLNQSLVEKAKLFFEEKGDFVKITTMKEDWNVEEEIAKFQWADKVILQFPVNWMGVPWIFKKYMDEVFSAGMFGELCNNDGRSSSSPKKGYGTGGTQNGKEYMLSLTFNAPEEAFDDESEYLFEGKGVEDLMLPMHANFKFFGMKGLPTFSCYDVLKNPDIKNDFQRFENHLKTYF